MDDYFPLTIGSSWSYSDSRSNDLNATVKGSIFIGGECLVEIRWGNESFLYMKTPQQVRCYPFQDAAGGYFSNPITILEQPLVPGKTWKSGRGILMIIKGEEEINVSSGVFKCIKVEAKLEDGTDIEDCWYAPGVGLVQRYVYPENFSLKLKEYKILKEDKTGSIYVSSTPQGAKIAIDRLESGKNTPFTFTNLSVGSHSVSIFKEGFPGLVKRVSVSEGGQVSLSLPLDLIGEWVKYTPDDGLAGNYVNSIAIDKDGTLWIGTHGGGVSMFDGFDWKILDQKNSPLDDYIMTIAIDEAGNKWFGSHGKGVFRLNKETGEWINFRRDNSGLQDDFIASIAVNGKDLWFGTEDGGAAKFDGENWTVYDTSNSGLPDNWINAIALNRGCIWFGTKNGVCRFDGQDWTIYNTSNSGLKSNNIRSIYVNKDGDVWFGTHLGGVSRFDGEDWFTFSIENNSLISDSVWAIAGDTYGNIWFGTAEGLTLYDGKEWMTITDRVIKGRSIGRGRSVISLAVDGDSLWCGVGYDLCKFRREGIRYEK